MAYDANTANRTANLPADTTITTGFPFWDMMLSLGKASQQVLTSYAPHAEYGTQSDQSPAHRTASNVEVIPVGEETLNVGTRLVAGETTRVRRVVVETPVQQDVFLREERVVVERRKPSAATATATQGLLTETTVEMSDSFEVVEVWKSVRVTEEVVLRREVTERRETVRDTVRRDEVVVEQAKRTLPAPRNEAVQQDRNVPALPQAHKPDPAQLAADLKKVAERAGAEARQHDKAQHDKTAALHRSDADATKADHKQATSHSHAETPKTVPAQPKASTPARPEASTAHNDKGSHGHKG